MPPLELMDRTEYAVLWAASGIYDEYGVNKVSSTPVEIRVRWDETRRQMNDPNGNVIVVDAQVVVDRVIRPGSKMWRGQLANWNAPGTGSVGDDSEVMTVAAVDSAKDLKGRVTQRTVGLTKFTDKLPAQT